MQKEPNKTVNALWIEALWKHIRVAKKFPIYSSALLDEKNAAEKIEEKD